MFFDERWEDDEAVSFKANLPLDNFPGWFVEVSFRHDRHGTVAREVKVKQGAPGRPGEPVTTRMLRSIRLGELQRAAEETIRRGVSAGSLPEQLRSAFAETPRPGRRGRPPRFYADLAANYVERLSSPRPVAELAEAMHLSTSQVRNLLFQARERGLLTSAGPRRAGGDLTDKARRLLEEDD